jgi:H+/Cl- antiporter ClcA
MGAAVASVLRLPLSAVVLATMLTSTGGTGDEPLIIVGVVVAYLVTLLMSRAGSAERSAQPDAQPTQAGRTDGSAVAEPQPRPA